MSRESVVLHQLLSIQMIVDIFYATPDWQTTSAVCVCVCVTYHVTITAFLRNACRVRSSTEHHRISIKTEAAV